MIPPAATCVPAQKPETHQAAPYKLGSGRFMLFLLRGYAGRPWQSGRTTIRGIGERRPGASVDQ